MNYIEVENYDELSRKAAAIIAAQVLTNPKSVLGLATGSSPLGTYENLIKANKNKDVDFSEVVTVNLDEYVDLPETHGASFRKYLKEKFTSKVNLKAAYFVEGTKENMAYLSKLINESPVDVGLIGIGENAHIAFNDPPADFNVEDPYIIVNLNDTCKKQQVGEGWFATVDDVPKQAVSMSVKQIMKCKNIVSCVPYAVKAKAVFDTLNNDLTNTIPATMLKQHEAFTLYIDAESAGMLDMPVKW